MKYNWQIQRPKHENSRAKPPNHHHPPTCLNESGSSRPVSVSRRSGEENEVATDSGSTHLDRDHCVFSNLFSTVCFSPRCLFKSFQMSAQEKMRWQLIAAAPTWITVIITLVAFVWLFSTVCFQIFSPLCVFKCLPIKEKMRWQPIAAAPTWIEIIISRSILHWEIQTASPNSDITLVKILTWMSRDNADTLRRHHHHQTLLLAPLAVLL